MVTLRPMTDDEYEPYMRFLREDYARERAESGDTPIEEEREASERQIAGLLPQGLHTPAHLFWSVVAPPDTVVGALWVHVEEAKKRAFIYDINLREDQRGKGYGRQTLESLEHEMRARGVARIALNVFAKNTVARHLYDSVGYHPVATYMQKDI